MERINWPVLIPVVLYLIGIYALAWYSCSKREKDENFLREYFIGSRSMGGFVLAMTVVATYTSASSFIGGPGVAYKSGLGWVLLAVIQVPAACLTLGVLGKKFAIIARRIDAITVNDFLRERYRSNCVTIVASLSLFTFLISAITAQFIGGARIFETITGMHYYLSLTLFAGTVVLYTTIGGFRAVALTDSLQGIVMIIGTAAMIYGIARAGGGMSNVMSRIMSENPALLTPFGPNNYVAKPMILSFWILVCFGTIGLPHTAVRCMGYRDSKSMHNAIVIGTFVLTFIMLGMHLCGALGSAILPGLEVADSIMPRLAVTVLPPVLGGLFLAGPLAGVMSTIDSQLIQISSAIVKDIYINYINPNIANNIKSVKRLSISSTAIIGVVVFIAALRPPSLIVWLNIFAFGGMEAAFIWPFVLGLYWKRANAFGAITSMICSVGAYFVLGVTIKTFFGFNVIIPSLVIGLATFIVASLLTRKPDEEVIETFWGK